MKKHKRRDVIIIPDSQLFLMVGGFSLFVAAFCWLVFFLV